MDWAKRNKEGKSQLNPGTSPLPPHLRDEISSLLADALLADLQADSLIMAKTPPGYGHKCSLTDSLHSAMTLAQLESLPSECERNDLPQLKE